MTISLPQVRTSVYEFPPYRSLDNETLQQRIQAVRTAMGSRLLILGHHYQQDEVIALSDLRGDSYQLSKMAAESGSCRAIAFCGVHFMAETADILANRPERLDERGGERVTVVLPDMAAGCSMADMAAIEQVEDAWAELGEVIDTSDITPVTYINSAASLKAFAAAMAELFAHRVTRPPCYAGPSSTLAACSSFPISIWAATRPRRWVFHSTRCGLEPAGRRTGGQYAGGDRVQQGAVVARALQRSRHVPQRTCGPAADSCSRH